MTACIKCGHDPDAPIARRWEFLIDRDPPSLNDHVFNVGSSRWKYTKERDAWGWEFRAVVLMQRIPKADTRRRVTLTRIYGGRQQERDRDNLAGGMKPVVDAMVLEQLIQDDSSGSAELHYAQRPGSPRGLHVLIEEFA